MLSLPSTQVKALIPIRGLTRGYTVKHTMTPDCIAPEGWTGRIWMVVLRDGEWSLWCPRCPWRSQPAVTLALALASGHICGGGGRPAAGGRAAAPLPARGGDRSSRRQDMRRAGGAVANSTTGDGGADVRIAPAQPLCRGEGVTNHADATSTVGGYLALAQVSVVRPVLGGRLRPAHGPALALGAVHLRTNTYGHQHHVRGRGLLSEHGDRRGGKELRSVIPTAGK